MSSQSHEFAIFDNILCLYLLNKWFIFDTKDSFLRALREVAAEMELFLENHGQYMKNFVIKLKYIQSCTFRHFTKNCILKNMSEKPFRHIFFAENLSQTLLYINPQYDLAVSPYYSKNKSILTLDGQIDLGKSSVNPLREAPECSLCCHPCCTWRVGDWMNPWFIWKNGKFKLKYRITFPLAFQMFDPIQNLWGVNFLNFKL